MATNEEWGFLKITNEDEAAGSVAAKARGFGHVGKADVVFFADSEIDSEELGGFWSVSFAKLGDDDGGELGGPYGVEALGETFFFFGVISASADE